jgi:hypothetical protein
MKLRQFSLKPLSPVLLAASLLSACGGGGSEPPAASNQTQTQTQTQTGDPSGGNPPPPIVVPGPVPDTTPTTMSCVDGPSFQCSGDKIIRTENGVALTSSGVQAYGTSTSDLAANNPETTTAYGLAVASGGLAEVRLAKDGSGAVLSKLGISWNGKVERPPIIETFRTAQARVKLGANGVISFWPLPDPSDYAYYDFADNGIAATQANYGNNAYFPRGEDNPPRCTSCQTYESKGAEFQRGDWSAGGQNPDHTSAQRLHGDGDIHAGNGRPGSDGKPTILPGGSGIGVPFPGSKGYRSLDNWSLRYGNLSTWVTQDTVSIVEWAPGSYEHSAMRRGVVAFGDVTSPAAVPVSGTATYSGIAYGWYASDGGGAPDNPKFFRGTVRVTVNFATRETSVSLQDSFANIATMPPLPAVDFHAAARIGAAGANIANYFTGPLDNGSMKGGVSGRYFGPVVASGTNGSGPAELGGAFSMSNSATGAAVVGGFIALKM